MAGIINTALSPASTTGTTATNPASATTTYNSSNPNYSQSAWTAANTALKNNNPGQIQDLINANGWTSAEQAAQALGIAPSDVNGYMQAHNLNFSSGTGPNIAANPTAYDTTAASVWGNDVPGVQSNINANGWTNAQDAAKALGIDPNTVQQYVEKNGLQWAPAAPNPNVSIPVTNATASQVNLNAPGMTIAGEIGKYLDPNSETNQMLKTKALEAANGVGTLNSSMTDSAISNGIIANAQAMGAADQGVYANAAGQNANMGTQVSLANSQAANAAALQAAQIQSQQLMQQMSNENQVGLTNLQNQNKTLLQSSSVALNTYQSLLQQISQIQQNASLDPATRAAMIQSLINETASAMQDQSSITGLNIGANYNNLTASTGTTGAASIA
ncbi:MAG: hypothetical protein KGI47_10465 [Betaproteobacteria bacterium]|nr:hypothetical protein [Betaproteobacteria bacterium]